MASLYQLPSDAVAGSIYLCKNLETAKDIVVSFDYACYGPTASGSEGFCIYFINSFANSLNGGGPGPGLCYTSTNGISALVGSSIQDYFDGAFYGELGVGFDITGNFGTSGFGAAGGNTTTVPNSIAIRDSFNTRYNLLYRSPDLRSSAYNVPLSIYQQTLTSDPEFYRVRVRLTDFASRVIVDFRHPGAENFVNYADIGIPGDRPYSLNACLGFSTGLIPTYFKIKNFNINGFFTTLSSDAGIDIFTYIAESYLGLLPTPAELTVYDTLSVVNAPPYNTGPILSAGLIQISDGTAPFEADDGYVLITPL